MPNWTQQELEELMAKMTKKSMTDAKFRKEVLADATSALEKLAGKPLPDGASLKCIERDPNYQTTLVLPDLVDEEKLNDESLAQVAGGIHVALIVAICGAAASVGPSAGLCAYKACAGETHHVGICDHHACLADLSCSKQSCGEHVSTAN